MRSYHIVIQVALSVVSVIVIVASVTILVLLAVKPDAAEEYTSGERPIVFYRAASGEARDDYSGIMSIAHNFGDGIRTTREAVEHGADIIEIDVVSINGRLYASHVPPPAFLGTRAFRGPSLEAAWRAASQAPGIQLDLKEASPEFMRLVVNFLHTHSHDVVIVTSGNPGNLRLIAEEVPHVIRVLSVVSNKRFETIQRAPEIFTMLDGFAMRRDIVSAEIAAWIAERGLMLLVWPVNTVEQLNELVGYGVDAITTENLAIMDLLQRHERVIVLQVRRPLGRELGEQSTPADATRTPETQR